METANGYKFDNDGSERGKKSTWDRRKYLQPVTQDILDKIERKTLLNEINKTKFETLSIETLRKINQAISKNSDQ